MGEMAVAPHAGAWIEIFVTRRAAAAGGVAPHAGAWIEIFYGHVGAVGKQSRPTRARGLKFVDHGSRSARSRVAPHAGAWIEISGRKIFLKSL